jgi:ATP-dependent DNA ligase
LTSQSSASRRRVTRIVGDGRGLSGLVCYEFGVLPVPFIPPMFCARLENPSRLADPRYVAEPKLDGQRAQLHVHQGRTVHLYGRSGRDLLGHAGMAWLREIGWPFSSAVLDGETVAGDGHEGIQSVLAERKKVGGDLAFLAFDALELDGRRVMGEPWSYRRKRLEDLLDGQRIERIGLVPVTDDAPALWETWICMGGEGIVLKERASIYRSGSRSPAWLKLKPMLTLEVTVIGGSATAIPWGDWGLAVMVELRYTHPRSAAAIDIRQAVRIPRDRRFDLRIGAPAELVCWGVMPSGMLRHPQFLRWL